MAKIKFRRDTTSNWATANSVLAQGEPAVNITTGGIKIGDGTSAWSNLQYVATSMVTPNIAYTGVFNGYPTSIPVTKGNSIFFTGNNYVLETSNKYWLGKRFVNYDFDISGLETLTFSNIGGIQGDFRVGGKSENLLTDINLGDIAVITEDFYVRDLSGLSTFNANNLAYVGGNFQIDNMDAFDTQFNFPNLNTIYGNLYYTYNDVLENTPQFPALETINNNFYMYYNTATQNTMTFDSLTYVGYINLYQNTGFESGPVFTALTACDYIDINNNANMINPPQFPALQTVIGSFYFHTNPDVTTAPDTGDLVSTGDIRWYNNTLMASGINFDSIKHISGNVEMNGCALDETNVNYVLTKLATLDGTNGTTAYNSHTVDLSGGTNAVPGELGLAAITTLEERGCTVYINTP